MLRFGIGFCFFCSVATTTQHTMLTKSSKPFDTNTFARLLSHEDAHGMGRVFMYAFLNEVVRQKRPFPFDCESAQVSPNLMIVDNKGRSITVEHKRNRLSLTLNDQRSETSANIEYKGKAYRQVILAWLAACIRYTSLQPELRNELKQYANSIRRGLWWMKFLPVQQFGTIFSYFCAIKT